MPTTPQRKLRTWLIAILASINLLAIIFVAISLQQSREQYIKRAESLTQNVANGLDQNISSLIDKIDLSLRAIIDELEQQLATKGLDEHVVTSMLERHQQRLPEVEGIRIANADGLVIFGRGLVIADRVSWADRDYFTFHRDSTASRLHVAEARMGKVAKQYIVGISRRYNYPDGRFAGVVSAPVSVAHFNDIASHYDLGQHGTVALRHANHGLISRYPTYPDQPSGQVGSKVASLELQNIMDSGVLSATYFTPHSADGYQRIVTFRRLQNASIFLIAGTASEDYLAGWRDEAAQTLSVMAVMLLLSVVAGLFLSRQLREAETREAKLSDSINRQARQHESLRRLNEIAALSHLPLDQQLKQALTVGSKLFELEIGIASHVNGNVYRVVSQVSPGMLEDGQEFDIGVTYCNITLRGREVVAITKMADSPYASPPCYRAFKLEAYIGTTVIVDGEVFGTVNFSSPNPYNRQFDDTDREFMGLLARWMGSAIERDKAQQDLAASTRHLQSIIETEPECVKVMALDGRLQQMNRAGLSMIEADSFAQVDGCDVHELIVPADRDAFRQLNTRVSAGESCSLTYEIIGLKGSHRWMETHAVPMRDNDGTISGILAVTRDISERKRAEAELEMHRRHLEELVEKRTTALLETEARASHVIQSSADGLYGIDNDGRIIFINPAACDLLGYSAEQVIGKNCHETFHHSHVDGSPYPLCECPSMQAMQSGETTRVDTEVYWHADGHPIPVMYSTHPMIQDGRIVGAVTSFVDISQQRAAAEARERALAAAEHLARVRSEFLANMSHEIRTPLNGVLGFAEIGFRNYQNSAKALDAFTKIKMSGTRLLGVINDVLDFSKIEAGKMRIEQTDIVIAEIIDHAVELIRERANAKQLALDIQIAGDLPARCQSDPLRLNQILLNVLSNAVKFTERGRVALHAGRVGDRLSITVTDTGIGMNESQLSELFSPFHQADAAATRRFGGTGLGLAISKRIAELMHGDIRVESQKGIGTTVRIDLPCIPCKGMAIEEPTSTAPLHGGEQPLRGTRILVAEDDAINQAVLQEHLQPSGAQIVMVSSGREAVERVQQDGPSAYDVVLMDVQMPDMDGYEATRRIRAIAPDLPVIAQTAHAFNEEREKCLAAGMVGHLAKPIDCMALTKLVREHAGSAGSSNASTSGTSSQSEAENTIAA